MCVHILPNITVTCGKFTGRSTCWFYCRCSPSIIPHTLIYITGCTSYKHFCSGSKHITNTADSLNYRTIYCCTIITSVVIINCACCPIMSWDCICNITGSNFLSSKHIPKVHIFIYDIIYRCRWGTICTSSCTC